jgi:hypothetical protein
MLKRVNNKTVQGANFIVSVPDIHRVRYAEGDKVAFIEIEGGMDAAGRVDWVVYASTLRGWEAPHQDVSISTSEQDAILSNISKCLSLLDMPHKIV